MLKSKIEVITDNLITIQPLLYQSLNKPIRTKTSITPAGLFVLGSLKRNGILSMSDIGKCLSIPKPHITGIIDKLIEEGAVERLNDPEDRRIINVHITPKGVEFYDEVNQMIAEKLKEKLILLDENQQNMLFESSSNVKDLLIRILSKKK